MQLSIDWSIVIAIIALGISLFSLWDNQFNFKLVTAAAKQIRLHVSEVGENIFQPCIYMNMALLNLGGSAGYLSDISLNVKLITGGNIQFEENFISIREFDSFVKGAENVIQSEVRPIGLVGKTIEQRGYVFIPKKKITQDQIPEEFDLYMTVLSKQKTKWVLGNKYVCRNISDIWQDLNSKTWNYKTREIEEIK